MCNDELNHFLRSFPLSLISSAIPAIEPIRLLASSGINTTLLLFAEPISFSASVYFLRNEVVHGLNITGGNCLGHHLGRAGFCFGGTFTRFRL